MNEKITTCVLSPWAAASSDVLERVSLMCRQALMRGGAIVEMEGLDLTRWYFELVPEHFDRDLGKTIPDMFHIAAIAPMP